MKTFRQLIGSMAAFCLFMSALLAQTTSSPAIYNGEWKSGDRRLYINCLATELEFFHNVAGTTTSYKQNININRHGCAKPANSDALFCGIVYELLDLETDSEIVLHLPPNTLHTLEVYTTRRKQNGQLLGVVKHTYTLQKRYCTLQPLQIYNQPGNVIQPAPMPTPSVIIGYW